MTVLWYLINGTIGKVKIKFGGAGLNVARDKIVIGATSIDFDSNDGVTTLTGTVDSLDTGNYVYTYTHVTKTLVIYQDRTVSIGEINANINDLLDAFSSTNILKVVGNAGDSVTATGFSDSSADKTVAGVTYDVYTHSSANTAANAALWIDQGIDTVVLA